jgi:hypothetical protein
MKSFRIKTHKINERYQQPHFYILNKGMNSGKPLKNPCPNCFVCIFDNEADKDLMLWLCFGLWRTKSFHFYLRGSVIPFINIDDVKYLLIRSEHKVSAKVEAVKKSIEALKLLDINEQKIKITLEMIDTARQSIFHELMKETNAG